MTITERPVSIRRGSEARVPKDRYLSRDFAQMEAEKLWPRTWQVACRVEELPNVGDYIEYSIVDQSILVVRSDTHTIKAYYNTCLHRGRELREGRGNAKELRCRYHAWRWNLDGSIKGVTDPHDFDPDLIAPDCLQLPECRVDTWGGFVFINMDLDAEPLHAFLGPVTTLLGGYRLENMRFVRYRTTVMEANWKTALDAFNEGYHTVGTHPQLLSYMDDTLWQYEQHGIHSLYYPCPGAMGRPSPRLGDFAPDRLDTLRTVLTEFAEIGFFGDAEADAAIEQVMGMAAALPEDVTLAAFFANMRREQAKAEGLDFSMFDDDELTAGFDWNIFPNLMTPMNAAGGNIFRFRPNGTDPESCIWDLWTLATFPEGATGPPLEREWYPDWREATWERLIQQDLRNIPDVQRGMHNRSFTHLLCGRQDGNIANFHDALMGYIDG